MRGVRDEGHGHDRAVPPHVRDLAGVTWARSSQSAAWVIRYGLEHGPDLIAAMAAEDGPTPERLLAEARAAGDGPLPEQVRARYRPRPVADLATVLLDDRGRPDGLRDAADLLWFAARVAGRKGLGRGLAATAVQVQLVAGRHDRARELLDVVALAPEDRWAIELDLLNPEPEGPLDPAWTEHLATIFSSTGLVTVGVAEGDGSRFDRLQAARPDAVDGPLVTVVMAVHAPDQSLVTSVRSITGQSWRHLQVIVVDDCSPAEHRDLIDAVVASDPRIELVRLEVNGGAYRARNAALGLARGELVTFQDADDWSHPQRIERQVAALGSDPATVASMTRSLRLRADLTVANPGFPALRKNLSSLMIRREAVLSRLGGFDAVRKSGDSEFLGRLEAVFGTSSVAQSPDVLALVQLTGGSLSRSDFRYRWHHPDRVAYREGFEHWHDTIGRDRADPSLSPTGPRAFRAPPSLLGLPPVGSRRADVLVVSGTGRETSRHRGLDREVEALVSSGSTVAMLRAETPRLAHLGRPGPAGRILELEDEGRLARWSWDEGSHAHVAVVRDPESLAFPRRGSAVSADHVVVVAGHGPRGPGGLLVYDPEQVESAAERIFGVAPRWLPATGTIAEALAGLGARDVLRPRLVAVAPPPRRRLPGLRAPGRVVVGTASVERLPHELPDPSSLAFPAEADVRVLDAHGGVADLTGPGFPPAAWQVHRRGELELEDFLDQLDVYVDVPPRTWGPRLSGDVVAAMARGVVPVLPIDHEPFLGAAAVHLERPADLARHLREWVADEDAFSRQRELGAELLRTRLAPHHFVETVQSAPTEPAVTPGAHAVTGRDDPPGQRD